MLVDESRSFGTAMAVVDSNIHRIRRREDLALILEARVRLNHGDRVVAGGVGLQVRVPQQSVSSAATSPAEAALQRPVERPQHRRSPLASLWFFVVARSLVAFSESFVSVFFSFVSVV